MGITGSLIVYISIWWVVFFSVLPIGISSNKKKFSDNIQGNDPGAPKNPKIIKNKTGKRPFTNINIARI